MKKHIVSAVIYTSSIILILFFSLQIQSCKNSESGKNSIYLEVKNNIELVRKDEIVEISLKELKSKFNLFNENNFIVKESGKEISSQVEDKDGDGIPDYLLFISDFDKNEIKKFEISYNETGKSEKDYPKRTMAVLGVKKNYNLKDGYYTGGKFENVDSAVVPNDHFAHDALYRIEGPGWESDKVAYRFYLDSRNRTDIFGKKTNNMIMDQVGVNDLVSNSQESYTKMLPWGMDIFKVGESLGIGSFAAWIDNKFYPVSKTDKVKCFISTNGPLRSDVNTEYYGWEFDNHKIDLSSNISISAGSRLTNVTLQPSDNNFSFCTGLAKHADTEIIKSNDENSEWIFLASYGKQSLSGDELGIAIFFRKTDLLKITEDSTSQIIVFKPGISKLNYCFCAAWQQEPDGIKSIEEFEKYLADTAKRLNNPIQINF